MSDSQSLRQQALERFGSNLLVTTTEAHGHVNCRMTGACDESADLRAYIQSAASDLLLLAETDYQVGVARRGPMGGMHWTNGKHGGGGPRERSSCRSTRSSTPLPCVLDRPSRALTTSALRVPPALTQARTHARTSRHVTRTGYFYAQRLWQGRGVAEPQVAQHLLGISRVAPQLWP